MDQNNPEAEPKPMLPDVLQKFHVMPWPRKPLSKRPAHAARGHKMSSPRMGKQKRPKNNY